MHSFSRSINLKNSHVVFLLFLTALIAAGFYAFYDFREKENSFLTKKENPLPTKETLETLLVNFFDMPLYFEKNEGQIHENYQYLTRCQGRVLYFATEEVRIFLPKDKEAETMSALKIQFVGANPHSILKGIDEQECKSNYFFGTDPAKWHTDISNYTKISYQNLYPGIDALFYGSSKQLEYDICVAPGTNPNNFRMRLEGSKELAVDKEGNLQILMDDGQIVQMQKPFIYQMIEGNQIDISGDFLLLANFDAYEITEMTRFQ